MQGFTVNGEQKVTVGSGGGGTPGGSASQLQYNNGGVFGGIPIATYVAGVLTFGDNGAGDGAQVTIDPASRQTGINGGAGILLQNNVFSAGFSIYDRPSPYSGNQVVFRGNGSGADTEFMVGTNGAGVDANPLVAAQVSFFPCNPEDSTVLNYWKAAIGAIPDYGAVFYTQDFSGGTYPQPVSLQAGWDVASAPTQLVLNPDGSISAVNGLISFLVGGELDAVVVEAERMQAVQVSLVGTPASTSDGDLWSDGTHLYVRLAGVTHTIV